MPVRSTQVLRMPRRVIATLDRSSHSEAVLYYLPAVLRHGDVVILLTVGRPPSSTRPAMDRVELPLVVGVRVERFAPMPQTHVEDMDQVIQRTKSELMDYLNDKSIILRNEGFDVIPQVLLDDKPARAIIQYARDAGPLFIAMATHGASGISHALSGSVSEEVVRSGVAPVFLVRP